MDLLDQRLVAVRSLLRHSDPYGRGDDRPAKADSYTQRRSRSGEDDDGHAADDDIPVSLVQQRTGAVLVDGQRDRYRAAVLYQQILVSSGGSQTEHTIPQRTTRSLTMLEGLHKVVSDDETIV